MNISSASQIASLGATSTSNVNSSAILRLGQAQIENRGSVIQPVDEPTEVNKSLNTSINNERTHISVAENNSSPSNNLPNNSPLDSDDEQEPVQNQDRQGGRQEAQQESIERQRVQELVARDREVRNHERAHSAVGGQYAGAPRYTFERGPDGINYAVGGEVAISTGPVSGDPEATIQKAQIIRRAALAPTEPSMQDRSVAAQAVQLEAQAKVELQNLQAQERIEAKEVAEARIQQREDNVSLPADRPIASINDADIAQSDASQNNLKETFAADIEGNVRRLSDALNSRISQTDPFGVPEPGQIFNQFI